MLSIAPLSLSFTLPAAPLHAAVTARASARAPNVIAGFRAAAEEDTTSVASACHLIPDEVLGKVSDLLGEGKATLQEYGYVFPKHSRLLDPFSSAIAKTRTSK